MTFKLYNTISGEIEPLMPLHPGRLGMYTCGPTVHDQAHIGNLRTYLAEDLLRRHLEARGLQVTQVMNITDVDDKIILKATAAHVGLQDFTGPFAEAFFTDLGRLGVQPAHHYPRATEYIGPMIELVQRLLESHHAYRSEGSVYFRIASFPNYGRLSHLDISGLRTGGSGRIDSDEYEAKETVRDFVLWKAGAEGDLAAWASPFGWGRPGWHLECSAMAMDLLGESFDLHCGGVDNKFPHHENEIAQSESATGRPFVKHWFHPEHLLIAGGKMAKSQGNFVTLSTLMERGHDPLIVRYLLLTGAHYRHKLQFKEELLIEAEKDVERLTAFWRRCAAGASELPPSPDSQDPLADAARRAADLFEAALDDDLNMPDAIATTFDLLREGNRLLDQLRAGREGCAVALDTLRRVDTRLGLIQRSAAVEEELCEAESDLLRLRDRARQARDFAESDRLRDRLLELGVQVEDTKAGTRWHRV
ncbi:MAG TPA: cysteine--tRNA ligase [Candidatus Dormibacteraeota bacterium]|nr:cysteine--tRNA ligase [Candidatus Dormibacteraeota bacterium]